MPGEHTFFIVPFQALLKTVCLLCITVSAGRSRSVKSKQGKSSYRINQKQTGVSPGLLSKLCGKPAVLQVQLGKFSQALTVFFLRPAIEYDFDHVSFADPEAHYIKDGLDTDPRRGDRADDDTAQGRDCFTNSVAALASGMVGKSEKYCRWKIFHSGPVTLFY